jgi:predicted ATPase
MLKSLHVKNFTVFEDAKFEFSPGLNVIVGANGTGKSHVLKLGYAMEKTVEKGNKKGWSNTEDDAPHWVKWTAGLQRELEELFLTKWLQSFIRQRKSTDSHSFQEALLQGVVDGESGEEEKLGIFLVRENGVTASGANGFPVGPIKKMGAPVLLPAKEVLSFYRGFGSIMRKFELQFDRTYLDLWDALALPPLRTPPPIIKEVLEPAMQGRIALEGEEFVFYPLHGGKLEINMVAEGVRKLGMLSVLLANGSLTPDTTLFWDEPEANLNPQLIKKLAEILVLLARQKFQIVLATHSLFLMKEIHILSQQDTTPIQYFSLHRESADGPVEVEVATSLPLLPHIVALQAEMEQADEFLDALNHADADV